mmetsp:Transcript_10025/g.29949  ORF Transcript_10025/g.29949 Transcript_10025/m.29949 type:complete len:256 (+) Transcript_10025:1019-1786(+)
MAARARPPKDTQAGLRWPRSRNDSSRAGVSTKAASRTSKKVTTGITSDTRTRARGTHSEAQFIKSEGRMCTAKLLFRPRATEYQNTSTPQRPRLHQPNTSQAQCWAAGGRPNCCTALCFRAPSAEPWLATAAATSPHTPAGLAAPPPSPRLPPEPLLPLPLPPVLPLLLELPPGGSGPRDTAAVGANSGEVSTAAGLSWLSSLLAPSSASASCACDFPVPRPNTYASGAGYGSAGRQHQGMASWSRRVQDMKMVR